MSGTTSAQVKVRSGVVEDKAAVTEWAVAEKASSLKAPGNTLTLVDCYPRTGRTHQLRRHFSEALQRVSRNSGSLNSKRGKPNTTMRAV